jgi:hypothetical protein
MIITVTWHANPKERFAPQSFNSQLGRDLTVLLAGRRVQGRLLQVSIAPDGTYAEAQIEIPSIHSGLRFKSLKEEWTDPDENGNYGEAVRMIWAAEIIDASVVWSDRQSI